MPDDLDAAPQALRDAAADGTLTEARIDESVLRIPGPWKREAPDCWDNTAVTEDRRSGKAPLGCNLMQAAASLPGASLCSSAMLPIRTRRSFAEKGSKPAALGGCAMTKPGASLPCPSIATSEGRAWQISRR